MRLRDWSTGAPPSGVVVFVWYWIGVRRAAWDGSRWRDHKTGMTLHYITRWHAIPT